MLSLEVKIEAEDQAIIMLSSLPRSYEALVTLLLVGKMTLTVDGVSTAFLEMENMKGPRSSCSDQVLAVKSTPDCGRSMSRERYNDRWDNRSQSRM